MSSLDRTQGDPHGDGELINLGVAAAAAAIRDGELTAESYAGALLRQARRQDALHSFITVDEPSVLTAAAVADRARSAGSTAPLLGVPLGIKDSYQTRALPTTLGLAGLREFTPAEDADLVTAVREAGGIVFGKNNLVEMSYGVTGHNETFGQVLNPYRLTHISGGSSSGSASSVAARIVPASFGGDTIGSIRIPAALNGVVGFKPTTGRWPRGGVAPISHALDTTGLLARHVGDVDLIDRIVTGAPLSPDLPDLARTRLGYAPRQHLGLIDAQIEKSFLESIAMLRGAGAEVVKVDLGEDFSELTGRVGWNLFLRDTHDAVSGFLRANAYPLTFDEVYASLKAQLHDVWSAVVVPGAPEYLPEHEYTATLSTYRPRLQHRYRDAFAHYGIDALIFPTTPAVAPAVAEQWKFTVAGETVPHLFLSRNTIGGSGAGIPGITLPAGLTAEGLPIGLELDAPHGHDRQLLALAARVQELLGALPSPV